MPELPEVETVCRVLAPLLQGRVILRAEALWPGIAAHPAADALCAALTGQCIQGLRRRGKYLLMPMASGDELALHLRMTGSLLLAPPGAAAAPHTHLRLALDDGRELRFADMRRFGRVWLLARNEEDVYTGMAKLGPEPLEAPPSAAALIAACGKSRRAIKTCLLDQRVVAGIGNIYSDEILFSARIRPDRPACSLSHAEWMRLVQAIPERLRYFVEKNAISPQDYWLGEGRDYRNTPYFQVYGHGGEPCPRCGETLQKQTVGGRGSVWCPRCQK